MGERVKPGQRGRMRKRERLYWVFRKSIQPAAQVFNEVDSLVI